MSRAANGTYTLPAGNPVVTATVISSSWANTTLSDLATEMTDSLDRSGKGGMLAALQLTDGAVGAPALTFVTETTMGIYRVAAGQLGFSTNSTLRGSVNTTGNWSIVAPSSGTTFAIANNLNSSSTPALSLTGTAGNQASMTFCGNASTPGTNDFLVQQGATNIANLMNRANANFQMGTNNTAYFQMTGAGAVTCWEGLYNIGTAGLMAIATTEPANSFTATLTGCTTAPTQTVVYSRTGNFVTLNMAAGNLTATSNTTACTFTGLPAALQPGRPQRCAVMLEDNTIFSIGTMTMAAGSGTVTLVRGDNAAFTAAGTKGFVTFTVTYSLV